MKYRVRQYICRESWVEADSLEEAQEQSTYLSDEDFEQVEWDEELEAAE